MVRTYQSEGLERLLTFVEGEQIVKNALRENQFCSLLVGSKAFKGSMVCLTAGAILCISGMETSAFAMQPQIPSLQHCNKTKVEGRAKVYIGSRSDTERHGVFGIIVEAKCDPRTGYPKGRVELLNLNMTDSWVRGAIVSTTIDHMASTGGHSPMAFLSGRCKVKHVGPPVVEPVDPTDVITSADQVELERIVDPNIEPLPHPNPFAGCRYWIMLADNHQGDNALSTSDSTADVVGVLVTNGRGRRIAHGTGPVVSGDISVSPSRD